MSKLQVVTAGAPLAGAAKGDMPFWIKWIILLSVVIIINFQQVSANDKDAHKKILDVNEDTLVRSYFFNYFIIRNVHAFNTFIFIF